VSSAPDERGTGKSPVATVPLAPAVWLRYAVAPERVRLGNRVQLLRDGIATFPAMLDAIAGAKKHVNLASYTFAGDATGRIFAAALSEKAKAGVEVNVLYDAIGSGDTPAALFESMAQAGVNTVEYHPVRPWRARWGWWRRDHRKILVVDGEVGFAGGINIADSYQPAEKGGGGWRDTHVKVEGPVVSDLQRFFIAVWRRAGGRRLDKKAYLPVLGMPGVSPARVVGNTLLWNRWAIRKAALNAFRAARTRIWIANAYFLPDGPILGELMRARGRGVDVRVMVPGRSDVPITAAATRSYFQLLLDEGIRVFQWNGPMLHAKTMVVDGVWSAVGSFNLDRWSLANNLEVSLNLFDPVVGAELEKMFEDDAKLCSEITQEAWRLRSARDRVIEWIARLLAPWL
jgi:cardiolipin synthase